MLLPYLNKELIEAGCDEAGRGWLFMLPPLSCPKTSRTNC